ncbi:MAG: N-acetylgalactosamine-6-sulfatase [Planctomycetota bacterium]|nr:MAG: N-acetylgalactosamine-6-sulfatase [Planctomycetota bacterium]
MFRWFYLVCCVFGGTMPLLAERPHMVFVYADDMGLGDVGCYGGKSAPTPNIDRLAAEGIRFTRYYSVSPICSPSRCGLITGQFPARWQITSYLQTRDGNRQCEQVDFLDPRAPSLPRQLQASGYATAHVGKWHLGGGRDVVDPPKFVAYGYGLGLGTYESPEPAAGLGLKLAPWDKAIEPQQVPRHARTRWMVDATLAFLQQHSTQPCFVNLWLDDTHTPWVPEDALPGNPGNNLKQVIIEMDRQIGRLMDHVPPNTLLIFTTDNGALPTFQGARNGGLRGSKLSLYEGGIRLPFIARWPGQIPAGRVDDSTVLCAVDIFPTLTRIGEAQLPPDYRRDGLDMTTAFQGKSLSRDQPIFWEYGRNADAFKYPEGHDRSPNLAMRDGPWKLLMNADGSAAELYDILQDTRETQNLIDTQPEVATRMKASLRTWRRELPIYPPKP